MAPIHSIILAALLSIPPGGADPLPEPKPAPQPDLVVEIMSMTSCANGTAKFRIKNIGTASAAASIANLRNGTRLVGAVKVPLLAAGAVSQTFSITDAGFVPNTEANAYTAFADAGAAVVESKETNNSAHAGACVR